MIKVGDTLPATVLMEFSEVEGEGCSIGPNPVDVAKATAGKTIALFALPGAYTPTCQATWRTKLRSRLQGWTKFGV